VVGLAAAVVTAVHPVVGLLAFQVITYIRPGDFSLALAALPIAKVVGGGTLVIVLIRGAITKSFKFKYVQTYLLLGFLGALFLSVPLSYWPGRSLEVSLDFVKTIIFFLLFVNLVRDLRILQVITKLTLGCLLVLAASSVLNSVGAAGRVGTSIGSGLFGDANDSAQLFVAAIPLIGLWRLSRNPRLWTKVLTGGSLALLLTATVLTQSRGGFLGLMAVILVYFVKKRNFVKGLVAVAFLASAIFMLAPSSITERYRTIQTYGEDASANARLLTWQAGMNMLLTRPFTGVGAGAFEIAFGMAYKPEAYRAGKWNAPHNTLVQVAGETGFPGLLFFVSLLGYAVVQLRRIRPAGTESQQQTVKTLSHVYFASFVGWAVCAFFLTQAFNPYLYFLIAAGLVLNRINQNLAEAENVSREALPVRSR
jgi:probable O-glycosylation ligase (exosortase A-associated)